MMVDTGLLPCIHQAHDVIHVSTGWLTIAGGTLSGGVAGWFACRLRRPADHHPDQPPSADPLDDQRINQAAADWAADHGRTQDQDLVAQKLRLFRQLQQKRVARRGWMR